MTFVKPAIVFAPIVLAALLTSMLPGCNTTAGLGKDIRAAGTAIETDANKAKSY
jgi:predicted small secreted protein